MLDALSRTGLRGAYLGLRVWWWLRHPEVHGAYVAVWHGDRLLLIRNSYRRGDGVPAGQVYRSETPRQAAVRELHEEVGLAADESDLDFAREIVVDFEDKIDHAHFFELHLPEEEAVDVQVDNREVIHAEFVPRSQLGARTLLPHLRAYLEALESKSAT